MEEMFAFNTPEIESFRSMYAAADGSPVLIKSVETTDLSTGIDNLEELGVRVFPNPVREGVLRVDGLDGRISSVQVFDVRGALVAELGNVTGRSWQVRLPSGAATYLVVIRTATQRFVERVVSY
ncbi:MAG: T9SS type A sorting domain-containing protein [Flavobacteriales bacterium]